MTAPDPTTEALSTVRAYLAVVQDRGHLNDERRAARTALDFLAAQIKGKDRLLRRWLPASLIERDLVGADCEDKLAAARTREKELREALEAEHEERCGCPHPGRTAYCIAGPNFTILASAAEGNAE